MLKNFSDQALAAARKELDDVKVSHIETLIRAAMPLLKELLDEELAARKGASSYPLPAKK